jgi:hypothetical protein
MLWASPQRPIPSLLSCATLTARSCKCSLLLSPPVGLNRDLLLCSTVHCHLSGL